MNTCTTSQRKTRRLCAWWANVRHAIPTFLLNRVTPIDVTLSRYLTRVQAKYPKFTEHLFEYCKAGSQEAQGKTRIVDVVLEKPDGSTRKGGTVTITQKKPGDIGEIRWVARQFHEYMIQYRKRGALKGFRFCVLFVRLTPHKQNTNKPFLQHFRAPRKSPGAQNRLD